MDLRQFFKQHQIKFGTSGIRANNTALTDKVCYTAIIAFLSFLKQRNLILTPGKIALAGDLRSNTDKITRCVLQALTDRGYLGAYLGKIPTPALSYYCDQQQCPGIMITGSHIEGNMNGIKFYLANGEILKEDEQNILDQTLNIPDLSFAADGSFKQQAPDLPPVNPAGFQDYLRRYLDFFPADALKGLRLGVYLHSSVAGSLLITLLESLGAEIASFGQAEQFQSIDTEALSEQVILLAPEKVAALKLDAIISTDGDGDRPLIADEKGHWLRGDCIGMLCAIMLKAEYVVLPITCNSSIDQVPSIKEVLRTRIGSPYVIAGIEHLLAQGKKNILGYEANGGLLLGTSFAQGNRRIEALPTRDGLLPSLCLLSYANKTRIPLSALAGQYLSSYTASSSLKDFPSDEFEGFKHPCERQTALIQSLQKQLLAQGKLIDVNYTDGLRLSFEGDDIIHLRCSGNSPELRCYTEAASEQRALELNAECKKLLSIIGGKQHVKID